MKSLIILAVIVSVARVACGNLPEVGELPPSALRPQPTCQNECHICEVMAAPRLRAVHQACPDCDCARRLVNFTTACPVLHQPDRLCLQGEGQDAQGCLTQHCAATHAPLDELMTNLRNCYKVCAGGYHMDARSGLPVCSCVCPLEEVAPRHRWEFCSKQCEGRRFKMVRDSASGCQECHCEAPPRPVCLPLHCSLFCEHGYVLDDRGCPRCECRSPIVCPALAEHCENECGSEGRLRDPVTGCITSCECQPLRAVSRACPIVGCNVDCGPHRMVTVERDGCIAGCSCRCEKPKNCLFDQHHAGICIERVRDQFGCPTCDCARLMEKSLPPNELQTGVPMCPEIVETRTSLHKDVCPNTCTTQRLFDGERKCQLCDCCRDFRKQCPEMYCEQYQVDHWGCPICACANSQ